MKPCIIATALLLYSFSAFAQENVNRYSKHEIFVSYGFAPVSSLPEPEFPKEGTSGGSYGTCNESKSGSVNVGYLFHISQPFAIGLTYAYNTAERDVSLLNAAIPSGKLENDCHTIMLTAKYEWLRLKRFTFYSRAGVGFMSIKEGNLELLGDHLSSNLSGEYLENQKSFAWQLMPVGVEWRFAGPLALFAEGGVGVTGCGMAGVKIRF